MEIINWSTFDENLSFLSADKITIYQAIALLMIHDNPESKQIDYYIDDLSRIESEFKDEYVSDNEALSIIHQALEKDRQLVIKQIEEAFLCYAKMMNEVDAIQKDKPNKLDGEIINSDIYISRHSLLKYFGYDDNDKTSWTNVTILIDYVYTKDDEVVPELTFKSSNKIITKGTARDFSFQAQRKGSKPNKKLNILASFADGARAELIKYTRISDFRKQLSELRTMLKKETNIDSDPFYPTNKYPTAKFTVKVSDINLDVESSFTSNTDSFNDDLGYKSVNWDDQQ